MITVARNNPKALLHLCAPSLPFQYLSPRPQPQAESCKFLTYLAMCTNSWSQKFPCAASSVHSEHPQDLKEAKASERCGQNIALVPNSNHWHWSNQHKDICKVKRTKPANKSGSFTQFLIPYGRAANFPRQVLKLPENASSCQLIRYLHLEHRVMHRTQQWAL